MVVVVGHPLSLDGTRGPAARAAEEEAEALAALLGRHGVARRAVRRAADHRQRPPGADRRRDAGDGTSGPWWTRRRRPSCSRPGSTAGGPGDRSPVGPGAGRHPGTCRRPTGAPATAVRAADVDDAVPYDAAPDAVAPRRTGGAAR